MDVLNGFLSFEIIARVLPMLLAGLVSTLVLAATAMLLGTALGVAVGMARVHGGPLLHRLAGAWIDLFRALPTLVVLVMLFYALPVTGLRLSGLASAIIALSLALSALTGEVLATGVGAVPRGQVQAAEALGVPRPAILRDIVLPQALRATIPAHAANGLSIARDTALASVVAVPDLLKQAIDAQAMTDSPAPLIAAALIYLAVLLPVLRLVRRLEERSAR